MKPHKNTNINHSLQGNEFKNKPSERLSTFFQTVVQKVFQSNDKGLEEFITAIRDLEITEDGQIIINRQRQEQQQQKQQNGEEKEEGIHSFQLNKANEVQTYPIDQPQSISGSSCSSQQQQRNKQGQQFTTSQTQNNLSTQKIMQKQKQAFLQLLEGIEKVKLQEEEQLQQEQQQNQKNNQQTNQKVDNQGSKLQMSVGNNRTTLMGEQLQKNINHQIMIKQQTHNNNNHHHHQNKQIKSYTKIDVATQSHQQVQSSQINSKIFNNQSISALCFHLQQLFANNSYICIQQSFQKLKKQYHLLGQHKPNQKNSKNNSMRRSQTQSEFNLDLTMKSKLSRNSGKQIDRQDSLIYSNATSFGLKSTGNKHKQKITQSNKLNNNNNNNHKFNTFQNNHHSSSNQKQKYNQNQKQKQENEFDFVQIDKTSSRGQVQNDDRQFSSARSVSDSSRKMKNPPRVSYQNRSNKISTESRKASSQVEIKNITDVENLNNDNKNASSEQKNKEKLIRQEHEYQVLQLSRQYLNLQQIKQNNNDNETAVKASLQDKQAHTATPQTQQKQVKKSFSIKSYKSNNKSSNNTSQLRQKKGGDSSSVFSSEIHNLQGRISRIKDEKLLKKKKLQEQLERINRQINQIKIQQENKEDQSPHNNITKSRQKQNIKNTLESRIKINDDQQQKKKAIRLVKNLRAQKLSRQNMKRNQNKVFDSDLHQQVEDIMKLKYFNQQRVKQKKKLQIIQRMKQQQIRKIVEQKHKQETNEFLYKLKHNILEEENGQEDNHHQATPVRHNQERQRAEQTPRLYQSPLRKPTQTPPPIHKVSESTRKKTEIKQLKQSSVSKNHLENQNLQKKKAYLNKIRNFTIIKTRKDDLYEQALN